MIIQIIWQTTGLSLTRTLNKYLEWTFIASGSFLPRKKKKNEFLWVVRQNIPAGMPNHDDGILL